MEEYQNFYPVVNNAEIESSPGINGNSRENGTGQLSPLLIRVQEMERLNANLKKQLDQRTKDLDGAVAANAKSISVIAHDLRGPLCTVLTALELIKYERVHQDTDEMEHFIKTASGSAHSAINLLDNLAEWAMLQISGNKFRPVNINLNQFIMGEIEKSIFYAKQKQINLKFSIIPDLNVCLDLQMVSTILRNLVSNAIKFTDSGGEITVCARVCHPYVEIVVTDNGIGISSENQKKIFLNGKIILGQFTRIKQGSGLGLRLCREFAEMHGGRISLESKLGKGSTFIFSFPVETKGNYQ
jgi:two-component system, sensor histidine kinase and response regulator